MEIFKTETAKSKQQNKDETIEAKNQKERIYNEEGNEWATEIDSIDKEKPKSLH